MHIIYYNFNNYLKKINFFKSYINILLKLKFK